MGVLLAVDIIVAELVKGFTRAWQRHDARTAGYGRAGGQQQDQENRGESVRRFTGD
jgi:hypothetical protein